MEPLLRAANLKKSFGTLPVIQDVSFDVGPGEVVGLTGSIGSGKSVLMMLLAGLYQPDEGEIYFNHKRLGLRFNAPALGIGVIHQRPSLDDQFSIVDNIFLGNEIGWPRALGDLRVLDRFHMAREARRILALLDVEAVSLQEKVSNLSGEQRQMIAIARVLTFPARLIIIDDPAILLGYSYQQRLLGLIQTWRQSGVAVLFSSSNIDHLFAVTDRILILDKGKKVADLRTDQITREEVVDLLLGSDADSKPSTAVWDFDSYDRLKEQTEKLRYHQLMLGKDLAAEPTFSRQLTEQMAEQVQALDQANLALLETYRRLLSEREEERKFLAREIHDDVIQDLLSINYDLEGMENDLEESPVVARDLVEVRRAIRKLVDSLRGICGELRPPTIDSLGLGAALKSHARDWSARTGIPVSLDLDENLGRLPEATELSIFRIVQEGLNNVWRHAQATSAAVILRHTSPRMLMISIRDDGRGLQEDFNLTAFGSEGHFGLIGIGERVALLGGRFRLQRLPEGGSLLLVEIPHSRVEKV